MSGAAACLLLEDSDSLDEESVEFESSCCLESAEKNEKIDKETMRRCTRQAAGAVEDFQPYL